MSDAKVLFAKCTVGPAGKPCHGGDDTGNQCTGVVLFRQAEGAACEVSYDIRGLSPGQHGFHLHEKADFSNGCASAGGHWNPHGKTHGDVSDAPECHAGDLGNITADASGRAVGTISSGLVQLAGEFTVIGRSVMVHADPDDLGKGDCSEPGVNGKTSHTTGNAGARVACGAIEPSDGPAAGGGAGADAPRGVLSASCVVGPAGKPCHGGDDAGNQCSGVVTFTQVGADGPTQVAFDIRGLSPGQHGFHIHEKADFSNGCQSAGGHWNPHGKRHGNLGDEESHAGDLGNIVAGADGRAVGILVAPLLRLEGEHSILGRSVMVHADPDDLGKGDCSEPGVNGKTSHTTGNAGARVACGAIVPSLLHATSVVGPAGKPCHGGDDAGNECSGVVTLTQAAAGAPVEVAYDIRGLKPNAQHGMHIHEKADFSNGCKSAGGHWNPHGKNHGDLADAPECHAGDLGNILADASGRAVGVLLAPLLALTGEFTVVGRSVMVHADPDDLGKGDCSEPGVNGKTSHTTGNAGARIACGAINLSGATAAL